MSERRHMTTELMDEIAVLRARVAELEGAESNQREAELALRESRARLRTVVSNAPIVLFALDPSGVFTLSEGKGLEVLGLKPGQVVGKSVFEVYDQSPSVLRDCTRALRGESFTSQVDLPQACFEVRYTPLIDAKGNAIGCIGVATDITDRTRAERALRESEQKFRLLAENIPGVIYLCRNDARYTMLYMNDATEALTGYPSGEFLSDRLSFTDLMHPQDLPNVYREVDLAVAARRPFRLMYRMKHRDGRWLWVEEFGVGVFREGKLEFLEGYITDVTSRVQDHLALESARDELEHRVAQRTAALAESEERFRQLAENIEHVFWMTENDPARVIYASPAYERIWGRSIQQLYERPEDWLEAIHPQDAPRVREAYRRERQTGELQEEYRIIRPDGQVRWIRDRGYPIRDQQGKVIRVAGVAVDITDIRLAENRTRQVQEELAHVLRLFTLNEMATGLAHELNQPLAAIVNFVRGAHRRISTGIMSQGDLLLACEKVAEQAERASEIVKGIRRFITRREAHSTLSNLNHIVRDALELADREFENARVRVRVELDESLPPVEVDPVQIQQVILNLLRNATEALESVEESRRQIVVRTTAAEGGLARVTVEDSGPGMSPEAARRAFEPFFSTKRLGLGMGLSISRSIIESHRGTLHFESPARATACGVAFHFTVPISKGPS